jgi:Protein of unknown function (DUF3800)
LAAYSHVVYIDEAGDEGFGKLRVKQTGGQSRWLLLGAALVRVEHDKMLPTWRNQIIARFPEKKQRDLHFRYLKHEQKIVACQEISKRPIAACVTFSNKATITGQKTTELFKKPGHLYNYLVRWLLERTTKYCATDAADRGIDARIKVIFSRRGGTDYQAMYDYMCLMRDGKERMQPMGWINWDAFSPDDIVVEAHAKWAGLQIADAVTSAFFHAVEPNGYGNFEQGYADALASCIIADRGLKLGFGITPVPSLEKCQPDPLQREFFLKFREKK